MSKKEKVICKVCHHKVSPKRIILYENLGEVCFWCHRMLNFNDHAYDPIVYERGYMDEYEWDQHY